MLVSELATPCLVLDKTRLERNLVTMRDRAAAAGKKLRPHAKTHKCSALAKKQMAFGNVTGFCAAKLAEAEALAAAGIGEILLTSPVVSLSRIGDLTELAAAHPGVMTTVFELENAAALAQAALQRGITLRVLIDLDPGFGRTGVAFDRALELTSTIAGMPGLKIEGFQCYCGDLQHIPGFEERRGKSLAAMRRAAEILREARARGLVKGDILTGTGTGTSSIDFEVPEITDIQVGSYCFMDSEYFNIGDKKGVYGESFPPAISMLSRVVATARDGFVTVDAGLKELYFTLGAPPRVLNREGEWRYEYFGDEHGQLFYPAGRRPALGEVFALTLPHCDPSVNQFDRIYLTSGDEVVETWEIDLRGKCY